VHDVSSAPTGPSATLRQHLLRTAVIVVVLGVLPFAWDADPAWQLLGTAVSIAVVVRSVQLVWRAVFSTDPRYLDLTTP
jgi:hypothetical protein